MGHDCILAEETFQKINGPIEVNGQRASALRFSDPRVQTLWHALLLFGIQRQGFRNTDPRRHMAALTGRRAEPIGQGAMTYQLRRLRLHGMIQRIPHSHRYQITSMGLRATLFFTRSYDRILRSALAFALPGHRAVDTPLNCCFINLEKELQAWTTRARLAS